jgi:hypothetical protein
LRRLIIKVLTCLCVNVLTGECCITFDALSGVWAPADESHKKKVALFARTLDEVGGPWQSHPYEEEQGWHFIGRGLPQTPRAAVSSQKCFLIFCLL